MLCTAKRSLFSIQDYYGRVNEISSKLSVQAKQIHKFNLFTTTQTHCVMNKTFHQFIKIPDTHAFTIPIVRIINRKYSYILLRKLNLHSVEV